MALSDGMTRRWVELIERAGAVDPAEANGALDALMAAYAHPPRHYHTMNHVADCLVRLDEYRALARSPDEVELALWFHDAIYDATRTDNEEKSAWLAHQVCARLGVSAADDVRDLVLATKHGASKPQGDEILIVDIDLSILGAEPDAYDEYAGAIRREYAFVDDETYASARGGFLRDMLARDRIYTLDPIRSVYEDRARANMARESIRLGS